FAQVSRKAGRPNFQAGHAGSIPVIRSSRSPEFFKQSHVMLPGLRARCVPSFLGLRESLAHAPCDFLVSLAGGVEVDEDGGWSGRTRAPGGRSRRRRRTRVA